MGTGAGDLAASLVGRLGAGAGARRVGKVVAGVPPPIPAEPQIRDEAAEGGKRDTMSRLPKNWRERVFQAAVGRKKTRPGRLSEALAILWATGLRPAELETGVVYGIHNGQLAFKIQGAKVGLIDNGDGVHERGIEQRTIYVNPSLHAGTKYLYDLVLSEKKRTFSYNKTSLRNRVNELGREVLSKLKDAPSVSPYSFRHAMCSDLKSCDQLSDQDRAKVMGHLSVESLESYGRRRRGGGGVSPITRVTASAEPRGEFSHAPPDTKKLHKKLQPK
jgi:integrase